MSAAGAPRDEPALRDLPRLGPSARPCAARDRPAAHGPARMLQGRLPPHRDRTAWLRMQSAANLSLPAIWEMQGDFRKMQGDARRTLAKSHQISIACMVFSLLQGAGRSREEQGGLSCLSRVRKFNPR